MSRGLPMSPPVKSGYAENTRRLKFGERHDLGQPQPESFSALTQAGGDA